MQADIGLYEFPVGAPTVLEAGSCLRRALDIVQHGQVINGPQSGTSKVGAFHGLVCLLHSTSQPNCSVQLPS